MRIKLFNVKLDSLSKNEFVHELSLCMRKKSPSLISTVNVEFIYCALISDDFFKFLNRSSCLNIIDGSGIIWAYKTLNSWRPNNFLKFIYTPIHWLFSLIFFPISYQFYKRSIFKLSGSDLIWDICNYSVKEGKRIFLLGYKKGLDPNVVEKTSLKLQTDTHDLKIAGVLSATDSPSEENYIIDVVKKSSADILLCGFGSPRQEFWLNRNLKKTGCKIGIGLGGTFDFIAGVQKRAPRWMQTIGLEWFYRLLRSPKRIKRQISLAKVAFMVLKKRLI